MLVPSFDVTFSISSLLPYPPSGVQRERAVLDVPGSSVPVDRDARRRRDPVDEFEPHGDRAEVEEPLPAPDHDGERPDAVLVDQVVRYQRLQEPGAPMDL